MPRPSPKKGTCIFFTVMVPYIRTHQNPGVSVMKKFFVCSAAVFGALACLYIGCNQVQGNPLPAGDMPAARNASIMSGFTFSITEDAYFREGFAGGGTIAGTFDAVEMADISSLKLTGNAAYPDNAYFYIGNGQLVVKTNKNSGRYKDGSLVSGDYAIEVSGYDGKRETLPQRFKLSVGAPIEIAGFSAFTFTPSVGLDQTNATAGAIAGEFNAKGNHSPFSFTLTDGAGSSDNQYFTVDGSKLRVSSGNGEKFLSDSLKAGTYSIRATVTDATNDVLAKDFLLTIEEPLAGLYHLDADGNKIWEVAGSPVVERSREWLRNNGVTGGNYTLVLNGSEIVSGKKNVVERRVDGFNLTIKGKGIVTIATVGPLFNVENGYTLILDGPELKLQGRESNNRYLIQVYGGTFILKAGTIEGNGAGGVWVSGSDCDGSFIMEGGTISDNKGSLKDISGGGVFVDKNGIFTMKGGLIEKNARGAAGGGVYVRYGKFDMSGGTISGNTAIGDGGGVCIKSGEFRMSGGTISKNSNPNNGWGGGVYVGSFDGTDPGFFELSGRAIISDNAAQYGGGVHVQDGTFRQSGGEIKSNTAEKGDGVYVMNGFSELVSGTSKLILTDSARIGSVIYLEKGEIIGTEGIWANFWGVTIEPQFYELPNGEPVRVLDKSARCFCRSFNVVKEDKTKDWFVNRNGVLERGIRGFGVPVLF
jgi:hypothetical protein